MENVIVVIGGGPAGMEASLSLAGRGHKVYLVEKSKALGGHLARWDRLFPQLDEAKDVLNEMLNAVREADDRIEVIYEAEVQSLKRRMRGLEVMLSNQRLLQADAVLVCSGFELFRAQRKEEYGYGIYENVLTSADLEERFRQKKVLCADGRVPEKVAFVHCVGSRDEKVDHTYCSKVCCVTAVKQACEIKELYPQAEVFNLYMDLRMFDRYFEQMYHKAQSHYGVHFVRGRLSEVSETADGKLQIKTEDTLLGRPMRLTVDMLVLMVGMQVCAQAGELSERLDLKISASDHFFETKDLFLKGNYAHSKGVFLAGACTGPKSLPDTLQDARSAAESVHRYLTD
ncbi:MAG: FAD-dependent oxidoreductase [Bacteroides sp.]|nr:FAD-dependent oxidoreductase [Bacteroides sp.]MCM1531642.1 FAD-dependent oxidoreductase [Ruminococcus flavefaciens]MCM1554592.1 FAD-dependent oxidoreductase [Bacteroides sp.]